MFWIGYLVGFLVGVAVMLLIRAVDNDKCASHGANWDRKTSVLA